MKTKSLLAVVSIMLCSVIASANADETVYLSAKTEEIKKLVSQKVDFRSLNIRELRDLDCLSYGKKFETQTTVEKDPIVNEEFKGVSLSKIKDQYTTTNISVYDMPVITHESGDLLTAFVKYSVKGQTDVCVLNMTKVGYRYVGELACPSSFNGSLKDKSQLSSNLYAAEYVECALPSVAL